jgi:hypothetical protein
VEKILGATIKIYTPGVLGAHDRNAAMAYHPIEMGVKE